MSTREERVLGLAREAWRASEPSEARVELAARRIERRLRGPRGTRPARRHTLILAFLVVFGGALAYAASGGARGWFGHAPRQGQGGKLERAARGGLGAGVEESARRARSGTEAAALAREVAPSGEPVGAAEGIQAAGVEPGSHEGAKAAAPKPAASPSPAASWRAVDEALDAKDDARAKQALEGLTKSNDATTRAKARLGLAQLAKSKGDCVTAKRLAGEVAGMDGVDPSVAKRARALSAECE